MTIELKMVKLDDVELHPDNARKGSLKRIQEGMVAHGFVAPIVIQKSTGYVVAGNHRVRVARKLRKNPKLNLKKHDFNVIPAGIADMDDDEALDYLLIDNKAADEAGYDETLVSEIFRKRGERDLTGTGYSTKEVDVIHARAAWQDDEDVVVEEKNTKSAKSKTGTTKLETPSERVKRVEELKLRNFVVPVPVAKHPTVTKALSKAKKIHELEDNWQVLAKLLQLAGFLPDDFEIVEKKAKGKAKAKK